MSEKAYVYGAGVYGKKCYEYLENSGVTVTAFIVTKNEGNPPALFGVPVISIDEFKVSQNIKIYVALKEAYRDEVVKVLKKKGITQFVFYPDIKEKNMENGILANSNAFIKKQIEKCIAKSFYYNLRALGLDKKKRKRQTKIQKLKNYKELFECLDESFCTIENESCLFDRLNDGQDLALFVSHELSLTGAPVALMNFAVAVKNLGKCVLFVSPKDGKLNCELKNKKIPFAIIPELYESDFLYKTANCYKFVVVNTIVGAPIVSKLNGRSLPVLWWIHEAEYSYSSTYVKKMPTQLSDNVQVYCPGLYPQNELLKHRPKYTNIKHLYYTSPDLTKNSGKHKHNKKVVFASVGVFSHRKAQDVLASAILELPYEIIEKSLFYIIGQKYDVFITEQLLTLEKMFPENINVLDEMPQRDLWKIYSEMDCFVCSSRDDPMPIVVTDAFSLSKLVICSENAGSSDLIKKMNAGIVYENNSPSRLAECIKFVVDNINSDVFGEKKLNARKIYETYFSQKVFEKNIRSIILEKNNGRLPVDGGVSVVIPSYNGGNDIKCLVASLQRQKNVEKLEIIVVDSGSSDGSDIYAEENGAKVIRITQSDFSHSYARNLGAENGTGKYLLFMTQDALPYNDFFVVDLLQPILRGDCVAVSCRQLPRPNCDLLGRIQNYIHLDFMGITKYNRILSMPQNTDYVSLRQNAQLDDVTCLFRKDVFDRYKYRGNYAEDLDMGLRLIRDGHKLALMSSVKVIHSHSRPAFYHFRRSIVDVCALDSMLPSEHAKISASSLINQVIGAFFVLDFIMKESFRLTEVSGFSELKCVFETLWNKALEVVPGYYEGQIMERFDSSSPMIDRDLKTFFKQMIQFADISDIEFEASLARSQMDFLLETAFSQINTFGVSFSKQLVVDVLDLYVKFFGLSVGSSFANFLLCHNYDKDGLISFINEYTKGI